MLTPLDIHNKVFQRAFRGYHMEEVDIFLDEIIRTHESLFRENKELKEKIDRLEGEIAKGREVSATIEKTMMLAQKVYEEETLRAKKEGDLILWGAEKKGEELLQEARQEVLEIRQKIEHLRLYEKQLYLKHKGFLEFQMELLDGYSERDGVLSEGEMDLISSGSNRESRVAEEEAEGYQGSLPDVVSLNKEEAEGGPETDAPEEEANNTIEPAGENEGISEAVLEPVSPAADSSEEMTDLPASDDVDTISEIKGNSVDVATSGNDQVPDAAKDELDSPFILKKEVDSMEQVVLLAEKMEEALMALDSMYGTDENGEES